MDEMEQAHRRDAAYERDLRDTWMMLDVLLRNERLPLRLRPEIGELAEKLRSERDHIVAVWD